MSIQYGKKLRNSSNNNKMSQSKSRGKKSYQMFQNKELRQYFCLKMKVQPNSKRQRMLNKKIERGKVMKCLNREDYYCCICLELMLNPVLLRCGHPYCLSCVESLSLFDKIKTCSVCRKDNDFNFYEKDSFLTKMIEYLKKDKFQVDATQLQRYKERSHTLQQQQRRGLRLNHIIGDQIEARMDNEWQSRKILSIYHKKEARFYKIQGQKPKQTVIIPANSLNLREILHLASFASFFMQNEVLNFDSASQVQQVPNQEREAAIIIDYTPMQNEQLMQFYDNNVFDTPVRQILQIEDKSEQIIQNIIVQHIERRPISFIVIDDD